jgi:uncharacterized protein (TIGR03437 family)
VFLYGVPVNVQATASNPFGNITSVTFFANSNFIGSSKTAPYTFNWNNMLPGTYQLLARAEDNRGVSVTSIPITVRISKTLHGVRNAKNSIPLLLNSSTSANNASSNQSIITGLVASLEQTYTDLISERDMFSEQRSDIDRYLYAALVLARASSGLSAEQAPVASVNDRLRKVLSYLSFCEDLMERGVISSSTIAEANYVNARVDLSIAGADSNPAAVPGFNLLPNGIARIRTSAANPFTTGTGDSPGSFELADVSVTINNRSAVVRAVSPTELLVVVPAGTPGGIASVVVTSRDGFVHSDVANVSGLNPRIFGPSSSSDGQGVTVDALSMIFGTVRVNLPLVIGLDGRRRVSVLATGVSSGLNNSDPHNDIWLANGRVLENLAEEVSVEARTTDGRVFSLPVEYAGSQGDVRGVDQVSIVLIPELAHAGTVQLTVVAGGSRSNTITITID